jgi:hypothetical protein
VRWIVDGVNVIGARPDGWWRDRRRALTAIVDHLETWSFAERNDITVVFEKPPTPPLDSPGITIAHPPAAAPNFADDEIVRLGKDGKVLAPATKRRAIVRVKSVMVHARKMRWLTYDPAADLDSPEQRASPRPRPTTYGHPRRWPSSSITSPRTASAGASH